MSELRKKENFMEITKKPSQSKHTMERKETEFSSELSPKFKYMIFHIFACIILMVEDIFRAVTSSNTAVSFLSVSTKLIVSIFKKYL